MTDRPIPRRGLIGCWFLDDRGLTYNAGANQVIDRSGRGNNATYQNGVTVGTEGDPSREFGGASFDASSNQYADVGDPLAVNGPQAIVAISKTDVLDSNAHFIFSNGEFTGTGVDFGIDGNNNGFVSIPDGAGDTQKALWTGIQSDTYVSQVGFYDGSQVGLYANDDLKDTTAMSTVTAGNLNATVGADADVDLFWDGEISAIARYDLTVPNAPEPSEIAESWDRLTDIPATR